MKKTLKYLLMALICSLMPVVSVNAGQEHLALEKLVIWYGGFPEIDSSEEGVDGDMEHTADKEVLSIFMDDLYSSVRGFETSLDVSEYGFSVDEVTNAAAEVLNSNPGLFYVTGMDARCDEDGRVVSVIMDYEEDAQSKSLAYETETAHIIAGMDPNWCDLQKAMYLHDYLVMHCSYDYTYTRGSAYDALLDHSCVCEGYAVAYYDICKKAGVPIKYVHGSVIMEDGGPHAWNMVRIDGKWYYVDCTWDDWGDAYDEGYGTGFCSHEYMLCSQTGMERGHKRAYITEAECSLYGQTIGTDGQVVDGVYENTEFDTAPWKEHTYSPFICVNDDILFMQISANTALYRQSCNDGKAECLNDFGGDYYGGGCLGKVGKAYFAATDDKIYSIDPDTYELKLLYELTAEEKSKGNISYLKGEAAKLKYGIVDWVEVDGENKNMVTASGYIDVADKSGLKVKSVALDKTSHEFTKLLDTVKLNATVESAGESSVRWISTDPAVVVVDQEGLVTCVGEGEACIYAVSEGCSAVCLVKHSTENRRFEKYNMDDGTIEVQLESHRGLLRIVYDAQVSYNGLKHVNVGGKSSGTQKGDINIAVYEGERLMDRNEYSVSFSNNKDAISSKGSFFKITLKDEENKTLIARLKRNKYYFKIRPCDIGSLQLSTPVVKEKNGTVKLSKLYYMNEAGKKTNLKPMKKNGKGDFSAERMPDGRIKVTGNGNYCGVAVF